MKQVLGVVFLILSVTMTAVVLYSVGMMVTGYPGYWGVSLGVGLSTAVAWMITRFLLKKH